MPAKHTRHIALTAPMAAWVDAQVAAGEYASASDLIRTAIRLLQERDESRLSLKIPAPELSIQDLEPERV